MDLEAMSKEELIEYIKELNESQSGKYGLIWDKEKEPEKVIKDYEKFIPVLTEVKENAIISEDSNNNILIEGDNFYSINVLSYTHKEKIDIIYIDPPYNTGSKDFTYNDKFVDSEDGYRHSKWLNFMEKRLKLAKFLLKKEGVIFISIDDNEYAQLKLLCDKIFDEHNYLGTIIQNKGNAQNDATDIQKNHEYILTYRRQRRVKDGKVIPTLENVIRKEKEIIKDDKGYYYKNGGITTGGEGGTLNHRPNLGYTIYYNPETNDFLAIHDYNKDLARISNNEKEIYTDNEELINKGYKIIRPPKKGKLLGVWTWSIEKFNNEKENILISKYKDKYSVIKKQYVDEQKVVEVDGKLMYYEDVISNTKSIIDYSTAYGSTILNKIIGETKVFNNPKNHEMIKYLISLYPNKNATILDFFAGSGTTGQAVLELNKEDGGNRRFVLCTNNENDICRNITYKRLYNTILGTKDIDGISSNLKYFTIDFVENSNNLDQLYLDLAEKCILLICIKEDCYELITENDEYKIFKNNDGTKYTCIYYSLFGTKEEEFIKELNNIQYDKAIYKFALGSEIDTTIFEDMSNYTIEIFPHKIVSTHKKNRRIIKE